MASSCIDPCRRWRRHLCQNHAFVDGNKRAGANAAITFLLMNDWEPTFDEDELADLVLAVASGTVEKPDLIQIFEARCRPIGDSPGSRGPAG